MDRSQLEARYPLVRPITSEGAETFLARSESGAIVMVHFLDAPLAVWRGGVLATPERLTPERRERILELLEVEGRGAVVTRFLLDFRSLPEWLGAAEAASAATSGATEEFQRLFESAADPPPDALADAPPYSPEADAEVEPIADDPVPEEPGEFTRLFRSADVATPAGSAPTRESAPLEGPPPAPREPPQARTPTSPSPEPPAEAEVPAPQPQAGEFTRMFQKLSGGGSAADSAIPPVMPPPPAAPLQPPAEPVETQLPLGGDPSLPSVTGADDYRQRLYQPSDPSPPPPPPAAAPPSAPLRRTAIDPELPPLPAEMAPAAPPPSPLAGEYTRMVTAQPAPVPPPPSLPAASPSMTPTSEPERPPRRIGPLIGLAMVVLAALLLIVYLVVRSAGSGAPTDPAAAEPAEAPAAESM